MASAEYMPPHGREQDAWRRQGKATRLLGALAARHPGAALFLPPLFPEGLARHFFERTGFQRTELTQLEMARDV